MIITNSTLGLLLLFQSFFCESTIFQRHISLQTCWKLPSQDAQSFFVFHLCEVVSENPGLEIPSPGIIGLLNTENFNLKVLGVVGLSTSDFRSLDLSNSINPKSIRES